MALRIVEGPIGSGKTYYAVQHLLKNYYSWDKEKEVWISNPDVEVISNIDGFKLGLSLDEAIEQAGGMERFFMVPYQQEFLKGRSVVYVIDEAQGPDFFHRKFFNKDVFYFFQYHRHLGVDVYLITQDVTSLAKELQNLAEFHVKVKGRVRSMTGEFGYSFVSGGESFKTFFLRPNPSIFSLYKSHTKKEVEKLPSAVRRYAFFFFALIGLSFCIVWFGFKYLFMPKVASAETPTIVKKVPLATQNMPYDGLFKSASIEPSYSSTAPTGLIERYKGDSGQLLVTGLFRAEDDIGWVMYRRDSSPVVHRATEFEFNRLCRCNAFARLRAGDVVSIEP